MPDHLCCGRDMVQQSDSVTVHGRGFAQVCRFRQATHAEPRSEFVDAGGSCLWSLWWGVWRSGMRNDGSSRDRPGCFAHCLLMYWQLLDVSQRHAMAISSFKACYGSFFFPEHLDETQGLTSMSLFLLLYQTAPAPKLVFLGSRKHKAFKGVHTTEE